MERSRKIDELLKKGASLLRAAGAREVYLFGSMAEGREREDSDVDLAVSGLPPEIFYATMARLSNLFERDVDLVDLDDPSPFVAYLKEKGGLRRVA
ncbi:MAG TPA: nucleotidyltransferase domain-containing protein [Thermoanaerobaculia bacterium]|nr:nucleotidyltransferase domain-containing protein [Thermoanaerobaculia bacterium]